MSTFYGKLWGMGEKCATRRGSKSSGMRADVSGPVGPDIIVGMGYMNGPDSPVETEVRLEELNSIGSVIAYPDGRVEWVESEFMSNKCYHTQRDGKRVTVLREGKAL